MSAEAWTATPDDPDATYRSGGPCLPSDQMVLPPEVAVAVRTDFQAFARFLARARDASSPPPATALRLWPLSPRCLW